MMPDDSNKKSIARSLGEFFGHIVRGVKTKVDDEGAEVTTEEVARTVEEQHPEEGVTLRRTTIDEIEIRRKKPDPDL